MKYYIFLLFIFTFSINKLAFSQKILQVNNKFVLIDIDESAGLQLNDKVLVYKILNSGKVKIVGIVEIVIFKNRKCGGKIISESSINKIEVGDLINVKKYSPVRKDKRSILSYVLIGTGVIASGTSLYFHNQANQTYREYESATTTEDAIRLFDKTTSFDKNSQISLGVGGVLLAIGIIYFCFDWVEFILWR